jgi:hypothetical protein
MRLPAVCEICAIQGVAGPESRIVFIGKRIDRAEIIRELEACLV